MHTLLSIILWVLVGAMCAYFANQRGRDPIVWFIVGMLFGVLGLLVLVLLPPAEEIKNTHPNRDVDHNTESGGVLLPLPTPSRDYILKDWFYFDTDNKQHGPVDFDILKTEWNHGKINADSFIWSEGMDSWQKIGDMQEILNEMHLSEWNEPSNS
jgi:hypothetical protein